MLENLSRYQPQALAVLRIMTALLLMEHGTQKLLGFPASTMEGGGGELSGLMLVAGILEAFGGFLILIGFLTRPVAFILCCFMAGAYFMALPLDEGVQLSGGPAVHAAAFQALED